MPIPRFDRVNISGNYFAGRDQANAEHQQKRMNALADRRMQMEDRAMKQQDMALDQEQQKQFATIMMQAAQYGLQSPTPKAFIEQNYPQLAQLAGDQWATLDDNGVKMKLQEAIGVWGPRAGVGPKEIAPETFSGPTDIVMNGRPSVVQVGNRGTVRPIEGASPYNKPTDPSAGDRRTFRDIQSLRKEFDSQQAVKDYKLVVPLYQRAKTAPDSRAGDISVIYALGKMFDPGSVVREGELILSQNAAPWLVKLASSIKSEVTGDGRLNPTTRAQILQALDGQVQALAAPYNQERQRFASYADENGWQPSQVVGTETPAAAFAPQAPEVTATGPNGQKIVLRNGQWVPL
jgi:hypothetical protein